MVLARPGRWSRFLAGNPARAVLLDPPRGRPLRGGATAEAGRHVPVAAPVLLGRFRHGLTVAWWRDGWIVQGKVTGATLARKLAAMLPPELAGRWRIRDGVLRVASAPRLLDGRGWHPSPAVDPSRQLACWVWYHGAGWPGWWRDGNLVLERGHPAHGPRVAPRGALLARLRDGGHLLALLGDRLPAEGLLKGLGGRATTLLSRSVGVWLRRLNPASPLPHPLLAVELGLGDGEKGEVVAGALRELVCPFGCQSSAVTLSDGRPADRWDSAVGSWWVTVLPGDAVIAATEEGQLETLLATRGSWPPGDWAVAGGEATAASLSALSGARLLAILGVIRPSRLAALRQVAVPVRGFTAVRWWRDAHGTRIEIEPAPDR